MKYEMVMAFKIKNLDNSGIVKLSQNTNNRQ